MNECDLPDDDELSEEEAQSAAEAAWERFCERFYGGDTPQTLTEQQQAAWRLK